MSKMLKGGPSSKALRGGAWYYNLVGTLASFRHHRHPGNRDDDLSFRLVMVDESDNKTVRGGSWISDPVIVCSANRSWFDAEDLFNLVGFRLLEE